jgi:hypothetical protein
MSEHLPPQDPNPRQYARPNDNWTCGYAREGKACRLGPDLRGHCRAASECAPVLEIKEGETKGRWKCMRPGGPCESGPANDGTCGRPPLRCSPRPTLRWWRGRITLFVIAASVAGLLIMAGGFWRGTFFNRGPISYAHDGPAFQERYAGTNHVHDNCGSCHQAAARGLADIVMAAFKADPGPLEIHKLTRSANTKTAMMPIDAACQKCHAQHAVHQHGVPVGLGCSSCHEEHRGPGRMALPSDDRCAVCHGDPDSLTAAHEKIITAGFTPSPAGRAVASSFAGRHPTFRVHDFFIQDTNTLRFNHALHLTRNSVTSLSGGRAMDCTQCHRPDAAGDYTRSVNFEQDCSKCHSLQFDVETPELRLPHGDPQFVSAFLRSLPVQYAQLAAKSGANKPEQDRIAREKLARLLESVGSGEELEKRILFSNSTLGPQRRVGSVEGAAPAIYAGCAYCHEVKPDARGKAIVTQPFMTERWLQHGDFNHRSHATMACADCHNATQSQLTADVILPPKNSCANCHSLPGGVADSCVTCHKFHTKTPAQKLVRNAPVP